MHLVYCWSLLQFFNSLFFSLVLFTYLPCPLNQLLVFKTETLANIALVQIAEQKQKQKPTK